MNPNSAPHSPSIQQPCWSIQSIWGVAGGDPVLTSGFPEALRQDLADVLPYLACAEAAAVHAELITAIRAELPPPRANILPCGVSVLLKADEVSDTPEHWARTAGLARAVCQLLHPLLRPGAPLSQAPELHWALSGVRQDKSIQARWARDMAQERGCTEAQQDAWNADMKNRLASLMSPVAGPLQRLVGS